MRPIGEFVESSANSHPEDTLRRVVTHEVERSAGRITDCWRDANLREVRRIVAPASLPAVAAPMPPQMPHMTHHATTTRALLLLGATVFFAACLLSQPATGWNSNSRLDLVFAAVDRSTLSIDAYHNVTPTDTGDKAEYNGHYFSDKTIGVSLVAVPLYAGIRAVSKVLRLHPSFQLIQYLLTRFAVALPAALAAMLMANLMMKLGALPRRAILATSGVFFGSLLFGYSSVFFPYLPGIAACLGALTIVLSAPLTWKKAAAAGGLLGMALIFDLTFIISVAVIGVFLLGALRTVGIRKGLQFGAAAAATAAVPLGAFALYSRSIFGRPTIPYTYEASQFFRDGMSKGVMGVTSPKRDAMWFLSFHAYRGILFWSPWLVMVVICCVWLIASDRHLRTIAIAALVTFVGYFLFNSGYYEWWGGAGMGPRLMLPMFAIVPLGLVAACRADSPRWMRYGVVATMTVAVALCLPVSMTDPQTKQGNLLQTLLGANTGTHLRVIQLEVLKNFYLGRWIGIKPVAGIPIIVSFIGCVVLVVGGTAFAYVVAARAENHELDDLTHSQPLDEAEPLEPVAILA